jgi:hypothetical protein
MEFQKVLPSDPSIVMFAKIAVNQGRSPGLEKNAFYDAIVKRANDLRADGESPQQAFAKTITDDPTGQLLYQAMKIAPGAEVKPAPLAPYDPLAKAAELAQHLGPAHAKLHSLAIDHMRAHGGMSYQQAYSHLYSRPENEALRNAIKDEHMRATMAGQGDELGKAAPMDAIQDDVDPGSAEYELHRLVVTRMKREPNLSYEQAFTREYLHPNNRSLKDRVTAEGVMHMRSVAPVKPFPPYGNPGDRAYPNPVGREGPRPKGSVGG